MKVRALTLRNFRNIEETGFEPEPRLNFLVGPNGQGKTSIIEGLSYLSTLRSFRGAKSDEVIRYGETWGEASCRLEEGDWRTDLKVTFAQTGARTQKTAFIDGKPIPSSLRYLAARFGQRELGFHSIVFNPSDHDLVRGEPAVRRQYLDRVLSAEEPEYLKNLQRYQKTLEQRNALLRQDMRPPRDVLEGFTQPLVELGSWIAWRRLEWVGRLKEFLDQTLHRLSPNPPRLGLFYVSSWVPEIEHFSISNDKLETGHLAGLPPSVSLDFLNQSFWKRLSQRGEAELKAGTTLVGPHRDDWAMFFGGQPLRGHGSQGEVRTALLALKLSEIELFMKRTGHRPLLLLDDFSSELDRERRAFLLKYLSETELQVFVTTTEDPPYEGKIFRVQEGKVLPS